jgi:hypothetical protein
LQYNLFLKEKEGVVMTIQSQNSYYGPNVGVGYQNVEIPHIDTRAPTIYDIKFPIGKRWIDQENNASYTLTSTSSIGGEMQATWKQDGGLTDGILSIVTDSGTVTPTNGVIQFNGIQQCATSGTGTTMQVAYSLNPDFVNTTVAHLFNSSVGKSYATAGQVTLAAGTATINSTDVTSASLIFLTVASLGTVSAPQALYVSAISQNTSFTITSASNTDTSTVNWFFIN